MNCWGEKMYLKLSMIILLYVLISSFLRKKIDTLLFVFACLWTVVIFLYNLKLFDIFDISENTEQIVLVGIIGFVIGYIVSEKIQFKFGDSSSSIEYTQYDTNINYFLIDIFFFIILIIATIYYVPNIIIGIRGGSSKIVKGLLMNGELSTGNVFVQYIARPFSKIMIATSAYCIINDRKRISIIVYGIIMMLFELLGMWSKSSLVFFALCLALSFLMNIDVMVQLSSNRKVLTSVLIGVAIFFISFVGFKGLYYYACGCIPMLDKIVNDTFYMPSGHTYGFLSFNSFFRLIIKLLTPLGMKNAMFEKAEDYYFRFETTTKISPDKYYNAFHTMFGDFYIDFGFWGVLILSAIFGFICAKVYMKYKRDHSIQSHILLCILAYYVLFSIVRFQMSNTVWGLALLYSFTIIRPLLYQKFTIGSLKLY